MSNEKTFHYRFETENSEPHYFDVTVQRDKPAIPSSENAPEWTKLEFNQCEGCEWKESEHCPVALRLVEPATMLNEFFSYDRVKVTVQSEDRSYQQETDTQRGLMALFGLIMATSGCPSMEPVRPLAWYHLPFANYEETLFRVVSLHLLRDHFAQNQSTHQEIHDEISKVYTAIGQVNYGIISRLRASGCLQKDASLNAITNLDSYARMISYSLESDLEELRNLFQAG